MREATVTILTPSDNVEELTPVERWEIVFSAAVATRAAIEKYIPEAEREAALIAVERIVRSDVPANVRFESRGLRNGKEIWTDRQVSPRQSGPY